MICGFNRIYEGGRWFGYRSFFEELIFYISMGVKSKNFGVRFFFLVFSCCIVLENLWKFFGF